MESVIQLPLGLLFVREHISSPAVALDRCRPTDRPTYSSLIRCDIVASSVFWHWPNCVLLPLQLHCGCQVFVNKSCGISLPLAKPLKWLLHCSSSREARYIFLASAGFALLCSAASVGIVAREMAAFAVNVSWQMALSVIIFNLPRS